MPYRSCRHVAEYVFHVFNRAIESVVLFKEAGDYEAFLRIFANATRRFPVRVLAFVVMPNHWHMILWPDTDEALSPFMQWLTETHARHWRGWRGSTGRGAVYQGRFKAVPIQCDEHLLTACRYVERNPLRAHLVAWAEDWPWSSASQEPMTIEAPPIARWPVPRPTDWLERLNVPEPTHALEGIRRSVSRCIPYGDQLWAESARKRLDWLRGRPRGKPDPKSPRILEATVL